MEHILFISYALCMLFTFNGLIMLGMIAAAKRQQEASTRLAKLMYMARYRYRNILRSGRRPGK